MSGISADEMISIRMTAGQWNQMLLLLSDAPYRVSAPLIQAIQQQCQMHEMRGRQPVPFPPPRLAPEDCGPVEGAA